MSEPPAIPADSAFDVALPQLPYPGLRPFEKHEWPIFFGRERVADDLVDEIVRAKLLMVHGDSGCGKSSLVRAGVLPRLELENARGGIRWRTCATSPGESPLWNLARDLASQLTGEPDEERATEIRRVLNFGRSAPARLAELLGAAPNHQLCLLVDQFEELFDHSRHHGPEETLLLTTFCTALFQERPAGLNVILTMRSEFLGACARFGDFATTVNATQYLLPRMPHQDLLRAIREPARLYGGEISRPLAERLVADAGHGQDGLPLIQHGLTMLHGRHATTDQPWRLELEHYAQGPPLGHLLSQHADEVYAAVQRTLPAERSHRVEEVFRALTDVNADGHAIRRPQRFRQLVDVTGGDEGTVRQIVDAFRAEGVSFLRPYGAVPIGLDDRVDVSHEALIRSWRRIADPADGWIVREFHSGLVWRSLLVQADSYERDGKQVLGPATTDERESWLRERTEAWAGRYGGGWHRVVALVEASVVARDAERRSTLHAQRVKAVAIGASLLLLVSVGFGLKLRQQSSELATQAVMVGDQAQKLTRQNDELQRALGELQEKNDYLQKRGEELAKTSADLSAQADTLIQQRGSDASRAVAERIATLANGLLLVGVQTLGATDSQREELNGKLKNAGYGLHQLSASYQDRPSFFSARSTVLYYSDASRAAARALADTLRSPKFTGQEFQIQRGSGLGVDPDKKETTLFVHWVKPVR
ncbi:MAG: ATP-binding protein [Vicinamibacterales bacterium]